MSKVLENKKAQNPITIENFSWVKGLPYADLYLSIDKRILMIRYHAHSLIDTKEAKEVIDTVLPYLKDGADLGMTDARAGNIKINRAARKLYRDNPSMRSNIKHAVVVNHFSTRILANLFISIDRPVTPTQVFNSMHTATQWLYS